MDQEGPPFQPVNNANRLRSNAGCHSPSLILAIDHYDPPAAFVGLSSGDADAKVPSTLCPTIPANRRPDLALHFPDILALFRLNNEVRIDGHLVERELFPTVRDHTMGRGTLGSRPLGRHRHSLKDPLDFHVLSIAHCC